MPSPNHRVLGIHTLAAGRGISCLPAGGTLQALAVGRKLWRVQDHLVWHDFRLQAGNTPAETCSLSRTNQVEQPLWLIATAANLTRSHCLPSATACFMKSDTSACWKLQTSSEMPLSAAF